jgi:hypothetical protein
MRDTFTSPRALEIQRKRRESRMRFYALLFVMFVSLLIALSYFSYDRHFTLNTINITGEKVIHEEEIQSELETVMSGRHFYLFSKKNSFFYPKDEMHNALVAAFPRIERLEVSRDDFNTLHIDITERSGTYLYCGGKVPEIKTEVGENCYFVNESGYIFDEAPYVSGDVYFKYYIPLATTLNNPVGQEISSPAHFQKLNTFVEKLDSLGFPSTQLVVLSDGTHSLYVRNPGGTTDPKIIFKSDNDLDIIYENLALSMQKPEFANEIKSKYTTLQYIDLRFKDKVLYKFQ